MINIFKFREEKIASEILFLKITLTLFKWVNEHRTTTIVLNRTF